MTVVGLCQLDDVTCCEIKEPTRDKRQKWAEARMTARTWFHQAGKQMCACVYVCVRFKHTFPLILCLT